MRTLTDREKHTLRLGAIAIAIYLALFYSGRVWKQLEHRRHDYQRLVLEAQRLKQEFRHYENKSLLVEKLKATFHLDLSKLSKATLVAEASAAIQKAATAGGVQLGPIRESPPRPSAQELATMQLEGLGPIPGVMTLLHRLETLGYPLIVDSVQFSLDPAKPGMVKLILTIVILDFEPGKHEEARHA